MTWRLHSKPKATIVSHRAQPLGEEQPDTAYRQVVVRLVSNQSLTITRGHSSSFSPHSPASSNPPIWRPDTARKSLLEHKQSLQKRKDEGEHVSMTKFTNEFMDNGEVKKVVEYLVMQRRVIRGVEEDWKIWGFAMESTPERIKMDEQYWKRTLDLQTAGL